MTGILSLEIDGKIIELEGTVTMGQYQGSPATQYNIYNEESGTTAMIILSETKWNLPCFNKGILGTRFDK